MNRRLPPLRALRAFEAAARHLSFARAADELAVTPAAISQQIKLLEEWLGFALFHRGANLDLTPAAASSLPLFTDAFDRLERASDHLRSPKPPGVLVVSCGSGFAARWLLPRLDRFQQAHPDLEIRIMSTTRLVNFATEEVDVGIRFGGGKYPGLQTERLNVDEVVPVAVPALAARLKTPQDLLGVVLLRNDAMAWDPTFPDWPSWLRAEGVDASQATIRNYGDEAALLIHSALAGLGVLLASRTLVSEELAEGRLTAVFPGQELTNAYHFVCLPERWDTPKIAAFRDWMRAEMGLRAEMAAPSISLSPLTLSP